MPLRATAPVRCIHEHGYPKIAKYGAQALAEAKSWLRGLDSEEAQRLAAGLPGDARGAVRTRKPSQTPTATKPFAHLYFWSGFILIGNPR
jgi:CHAT domain-containing protein